MSASLPTLPEAKMNFYVSHNLSNISQLKDSKLHHVNNQKTQKKLLHVHGNLMKHACISYISRLSWNLEIFLFQMAGQI